MSPHARLLPPFLRHPRSAACAAAVLTLAACGGAWGQEASPAPLRPATSLQLPVGKGNDRDLPVVFDSDRLEGTPGERTHAWGSVRMRRGDLRVRADDVVHTQADNTVEAQGDVDVRRRGDRFSGPRLRLKLDTLEGEFTSPTYRFARTNGGGTASRIDFLGENRLSAFDATYSSCTPSNTQDLAWVLETSQVDLDFDADVGVARNAVVRFKGVPILAAPVLSFPLNDARKSGFLPPNFYVDNKSGFEYAQPYYWNIAPNRDATLTPVLSTNRGLALNTEWRYLEKSDVGSLRLDLLPNDRLADRDRRLVDFTHRGNVTLTHSPNQTLYDLRWRRVSDNDYWKDFSRDLPSLTPRLFESHANVEQQINLRPYGLGGSQTTVYARVQDWQALQDTALNSPATARVEAPYRREPQLGLRSRAQYDNGTVWRFESEFNRFSNVNEQLVSGNRVHAVARVERPFGSNAAYFTPAVSLNVTNYDLERRAGDPGRRSDTRTLPTVSLDSGLVFERPVDWFGGQLVQTLEPRAQYVYTPYRRQSDLPLFDTTIRDFNQFSVFNENAFNGIDRVSDANQVNLGLTSRVLNPATGAESLRMGIVQKVLFQDQKVTSDDGPPDTQRLSDLLLLASTSVIPGWYLDSNLQYKARDSSIQRAVVGARFSPGPYRTVSLNYSYNKPATDQVTLAWQWPLFGARPSQLAATDVSQRMKSPNPLPSPDGCGGGWFTVGRMNYNVNESRVADALLGVEYDGGCWISRVVAQRTSTGQTTSSLRLMLQLELVGLSRIGTSPIRSLRENIPGYQMLREESSLLKSAPTTASATFTDLQDE